MGPLNVNPSSVPVPKLFMTLTAPLAPPANVAVIPELESILNEDAGMFPNFTDVTFSKLLPLIVTTVPCIPDVGENKVTTGATSYPDKFLNTEITVLAELQAMMSGRESPSRSPVETKKGSSPTG